MRRSILLLVLISMIISILPLSGASAANITLSDIGDHWAEDAILKAVNQGYVAGYPDSTFRPDNRVNVDEFIKMLVMSLFETYPTGDTLWSDIYANRLSDGYFNALMGTLNDFDP